MPQFLDELQVLFGAFLKVYPPAASFPNPPYCSKTGSQVLEGSPALMDPCIV